jgi:L-ascorbate oxidase
MECKYHFTIEWYKVLSKACYDCPNNKTDCDRPHCIPADGVERMVMSVNRIIPGPQIQVCQHDIVNVIVNNNLRMGEGSTIHWHGILQNGTPHMDGVGMITQCAIHPHSSFEYKFKVPDAGTHFWHSHIAIQRGDGAFGSLVVKSAADVNLNEYDYDLNEHVIILNDWYKETIISRFAFNQHGTTDNNRAISILINGKGAGMKKNETETPRALFKVKHGYRYRFRIINAGVSYCPMIFTIDNHQMTVIAIDGKSVVPSTFDSIFLFAGKF